MTHKNFGRALLVIWPFSLLLGCGCSGFVLEQPDGTCLIHVESGLYVHREVEVRVNAARFESPPEHAAPGAVSELDSTRFFRLGCSSTYLRPLEDKGRGDDFVWREVTHVSKDDRKGKTALGVHVRWEKEGATRAYDAMEIFDFPLPDVSQIDTWTPWVKADRSREGVFAWHAEANKHGQETVAPPAYPFQMRFRLVLSKRMYP